MTSVVGGLRRTATRVLPSLSGAVAVAGQPIHATHPEVGAWKGGMPCEDECDCHGIIRDSFYASHAQRDLHAD